MITGWHAVEQGIYPDPDLPSSRPTGLSSKSILIVHEYCLIGLFATSEHSRCANTTEVVDICFIIIFRLQTRMGASVPGDSAHYTFAEHPNFVQTTFCIRKQRIDYSILWIWEISDSR